MTTTVKVHVNGRYRATIVQRNAEGTVVASHVVDGNYDGSPNPSGEISLWLTHPATGAFEVTEEYVPETPKVEDADADGSA
ncbi:hypothetical protein [Bradyrhizobium sp. 188]|uniref:hypothetical protein n=1 Tax=Bradyrhizobium sp. 188 TaxID=2782656 RepID=UPI001FFB21FA|nr:hypothetical protein [Bradyrhizobium sp. 188]MCK1501481.1 hypothetical protein [Bradyrhizobium sp. 188]